MHSMHGVFLKLIQNKVNFVANISCHYIIVKNIKYKKHPRLLMAYLINKLYVTNNEILLLPCLC